MAEARLGISEPTLHRLETGKAPVNALGGGHPRCDGRGVSDP